MTKLGFVATVSDPCLFWKMSRTGKQILLFLFVDDMQVAFDKADEDEWKEAHDALKERFNITDLGESEYMLGMRITRNREDRTIKLDQELYITKALEKFGLDNCTPTSTPGMSSRNDNNDENENEKKKKNELDKPADLKLYQEKVGTLLYAAISTRPDIAFTVNQRTQKMTAPTIADDKECDRIFKYLQGSKSYGLLFGRKKKLTFNKMKISVYADADWATNKFNRKSITGWIAFVNGDPVSWASKKQKVVSQSTCEAELYAEGAGINEAKWLQDLLEEIGYDSTDPPIVYGDNQSTQALSKNGIKSERTKHVSYKYAYIYYEVSEGRIELEWIPTKEQLADILTKSLPRPLHEKLTNELMINIK
jgi:hypothetical protein